MFTDYTCKLLDYDNDDFFILLLMAKVLIIPPLIASVILDLAIMGISAISKEVYKLALLLFKFVQKYTNKAVKRLFKLGE